MTTPAIPRFISENNLDLETIKINGDNDIFVDPTALVDSETIVVDPDGKLKTALSVEDVLTTGHVIATVDTGAESIAIKETVTEIAAEFDNATGKLTITYTNEDDSQDDIELSLTSVAVGNMQTTGHKIGDITINGVTTDIKETVTEIAEDGRTYVFTAEDGTETVIDPEHFISGDAGNAIAAGTDGGLLVPTATDTIKGVVSLAKASNFPSTSDEEATTPAYVASAVAGSGNIGQGENVVISGTGTPSDPKLIGVPSATDTVKGVVSLAVAANFPSESATEAVTPAYLELVIAELTKDVFDA